MNHSSRESRVKVERLRDELGELRRAFNLWQNKVLRAFAVVFVLLALIGGSVWWFGYSQHRDLLHLSAEARHITREKIRAQLLESAERTTSPPSSRPTVISPPRLPASSSRFSPWSR